MKKRIMCFGDSNTWGAVPGQSNRHPEEVRWTGVLQQELGDSYKIIEEGYNGRVSVHDDIVEGRLSGDKYFAPCCDTQSPLDLIIIMLGTNDLKVRFGVDAKTIAYGFHKYAEILKITPMDGNPPKILLASPILIDPGYKNHPLFHDMFGEYATERSEQFAKEYQEFAEGNGWYFIDTAKYGKASPKDGVHMEPDSHLRIGKAFAEKVREIIG